MSQKMSTQHYLAQGIIAGRTIQSRDAVVLREIELARAEARRERRRQRGL